MISASFVAKLLEKIASDQLERGNVLFWHLSAPVPKALRRGKVEAAVSLTPPTHLAGQEGLSPLVVSEHARVEGKLDELTHGAHDSLRIIDEPLVADLAVPGRPQDQGRLPPSLHAPLPDKSPLHSVVRSPVLLQ